jgi:hypothetical protein
MGNSQSTKFGSVHKPGKDCRPGYYVNSTGVYYGGILITNNTLNFQKLKYGYLKSDKRVFYQGVPLLSANPSTFSVTTRNNVKGLSKFPEKNQELAKLNSVLAIDYIGNKKRIYYKDHIIHEE